MRDTHAGMTGVLPVTVIRPTSPSGDGSETTTGVSHPTTPLPPPPLRASSLVPPRMLHPRRVKSAVIVAAGLSTRMFPASAVVKKELFPIVDHDGVCKPVILAIMEGLVESGIERFVVVVQDKDIAVFDGFFSMKAVEKHKHRQVAVRENSLAVWLAKLRCMYVCCADSSQSGKRPHPPSPG